ncbi:MAG: DUF4167 domain-containing protein [Clostridia bacterium]|nr:DUF4167 domain-containing protein [Clostridia bacterium]
MKQNQKKRFNNGRFNNRNQQKQITRNTVFDSSGPCGKLRGTPLQLVEKYQAGAKDALMQNDIVLAQTCMQFADHYIRLQNQAIQNEQRNNQNNQPRPREVESVDELPEIQLPEPKEEGAEAGATLPEEAGQKETEGVQPSLKEETGTKEVKKEVAGTEEGDKKPSKAQGKTKTLVIKTKRKVKDTSSETSEKAVAEKEENAPVMAEA